MSETSHNALEQLKSAIGDYEGYDVAASRPQSDKTMRLFLIGKIKSLVEQLGRDYSAEDASDQERLESLLKSTKRKLITIHQSLKSPTYGEEPFFQSSAIPNTRLSRLYDLEGDMLEETNNISEELLSLLRDRASRAQVEDHFLHIDAYVDNINQALFEREALIIGDE